MKLKIDTRNELPLLNREELEASLNYEGPTPSRLELRKEMAKEAKAKENLVVIKKIDVTYGETTAKISCFIYKDEDSMNKIEGKYMINRHSEKKKEGEEKPAEPAAEATEEKKEEAPAEAPAEEAKEETPAKEEAPAEPVAEEKSD